MNRVVDASAIVVVLLDDSALGHWCRERVEGSELFAPQLLPFEVINAIRRMTTRQVVDTTAASLALQRLRSLRVSLVPFDAVADRVWQLRDNVTAYDASYVALAELLECPLTTIDTRLARASGPRCEFEVPPAT